MVRGIRGVHEGRSALVVNEELPVGTRIAFAVLEPRAASEDLHAALRDMSREHPGGVPLFGVYVDCSGRGYDLYGEANVDVQMLRERWPGLPIAGLMAAFQIGPGRQGATAHLYTGVFSLFSAAS